MCSDERDVLPHLLQARIGGGLAPTSRKRTYFGLSRNRNYPAHIPAPECIDRATLPDIEVSNKSNRYLFLIGMRLGELS